MLHEIGHTVEDTDIGGTLAINPYITDTGIDDPNSSDPGNLLAINVGGGPIEATLPIPMPAICRKAPQRPRRSPPACRRIRTT